MIRELKVVKKWQGNKSVSSLNLAGVWLQEHNFQIGDKVRIEVYRDELRIKKMSAIDISNELKKRNPEIEHLIAEFDCQLCE